MKSLVPFAAVAVALAGCVQTTSLGAQRAALDPTPGVEAVRNSLYDPFSAKFRAPVSYRLSDSGTAYCGQVISKNRLGGYTGWQPYYVRMENGVPASLLVTDYAPMACAQAASGTISNIR